MAVLNQTVTQSPISGKKTQHPLVRIRLPYRFEPRTYQLPLFKAMDNGVKRAVQVWHRRSGKEKCDLNIMIKKALTDRIGTYFYFFPLLTQGRRVLWDGKDREGMPFLDHFPKEFIQDEPNNTEMKIKLINGSIFQVVGTDHFDHLRGTNPVGLIFSEYSYSNPRVWDTFRPIVNENGGWVIFNLTPNGLNHGFKIYEVAKNTPGWFHSLLTVLDTKRPDGSPVILEEVIEAERTAGMDEAMIQQEYYCSWSAGSPGAYYAAQIAQAEKDNRITNVPYVATLPVDTWWDLGVGDATAIWFTQTVGKELRFIDYYESSGEGLGHYVKILRERAYIYGTHNAPHDIRVTELGTGKSRWETAASLGVTFNIVAKLEIEDGIDACRSIFSQCWFDRTKCKEGLEALKNYRKQWDEDRKQFKSKPYHDWASNGADAFRTFGVGWRPPVRAAKPQAPRIPADTLIGY